MANQRDKGHLAAPAAPLPHFAQQRLPTGTKT